MCGIPRCLEFWGQKPPLRAASRLSLHQSSHWPLRLIQGGSRGFSQAQNPSFGNNLFESNRFQQIFFLQLLDKGGWAAYNIS